MSESEILGPDRDIWGGARFNDRREQAIDEFLKSIDGWVATMSKENDLNQGEFLRILRTIVQMNLLVRTRDYSRLTIEGSGISIP